LDFAIEPEPAVTKVHRQGAKLDHRLSSGVLVTIQGPPAIIPAMILAAGQYSFWYFSRSTPLAPVEDRLA
jgi:hypothetical protein